jgi:23S rRNA (adenine-N6)-dimethyltransferase
VRAEGWHRLAEAWAERVVKESGVRAGDLVLDIGAGKGALTEHLVAGGKDIQAGFRALPGDASMGARRSDSSGSNSPTRRK